MRRHDVVEHSPRFLQVVLLKQSLRPAQILRVGVIHAGVRRGLRSGVQ